MIRGLLKKYLDVFDRNYNSLWLVLSLVLIFYVGRFFYGAFFPDYLSIYQKMLPQNVVLEKLLIRKSDGALMEACGGVIFRLSSDTVHSINKFGLDFLNGNPQGNIQSSNEGVQYDWKRMPYDSADKVDEAGVYCLFKNNHDLEDAVFDTVRLYGGYYSTIREGVVILIPDLGILIFSYNG